MIRGMENSAYITGRERLSLCMIAKNEEACIKTCLNSVYKVVDEIIVVDTGSNDGTKEICQSFGACILDYPWGDDFAAARNYGLKHATGDWILWLDADEEMDATDVVKLRDAIRSQDVDFFALRLVNYYGDTPNLDECFQISHLRLFRNYRGILFENKIHESLNTQHVENIINLPIHIYHYGYMPSVMKYKDKHNRNIQMLHRELTKPDCNPWIHYHIASEYYNNQQLDEALKHLNAGILMFILSGLKPPAMCYRLKYTILLQTRQTENALQSIDKAIAIYPDYVDLYFLKGLLLLDQQKYSDAEAVFSFCISLGEDNWGYLTLKGVGSFRSCYYRGLCLEHMGQLKDALKAYECSLAISPDFHPASHSRALLQERDI